MNEYYFQGMYGLGDNIYQRAFLRYFPGAWLRTPWPELYQDMDIRCVRSGTKLRTQAKNESKTLLNYYLPPRDSIVRKIGYGPFELANGSLIQAFRKQFDVTGPLNFDLPNFDDWYECIPQHQPLAIIRPATIRAEWSSESRNPDPKYLCIAARILRQWGYFVISIADLETDKEWLVAPEPEADLKLHSGELSLPQLCTLFSKAKAIVSPVGFSLPMAIGYHTPLFVIAGGRGGHNAPAIVTDPEMDLSQVRWALPDQYCLCTNAKHNCNKHISLFEEQFLTWLKDR